MGEAAEAATRPHALMSHIVGVHVRYRALKLGRTGFSFDMDFEIDELGDVRLFFEQVLH